MSKYTVPYFARLTKENDKWIRGFFKSKSFDLTKGTNWLIEKERERNKRKTKRTD
jgi:hypothetical protein